jgi:hypothetical protein
MSGLNNASQDSTGSNVFEFPNSTSPFTHHQQYALEASEPQANDASHPPEPGSQVPEAAAAPTLLHPQKADETVRSVRFNPAETIRQRQPTLLQPQKTDGTVRSVRLESASSTTEPCNQKQSEPASNARGSQSSIIQAPMAAAEPSPRTEASV